MDDWNEVPGSDDLDQVTTEVAEIPEQETQEPTQEIATQIVIDPRRLGQENPLLSLEDQADVCCILVPQSQPAIEAVERIYNEAPSSTITFGKGVNIRERGREDVNEISLPEAWADRTPRNLVLRLSANLKDPVSGWIFGRNRTRCDFPIGVDQESRRVSNVHFRIYVNEHGVLMCEDQSTNGTMVDGKLLRGKDKENNCEFRHTLRSGVIVLLTMTPPEEDFKFVVFEPLREDEGETAYENNLTAFFLRANDAKHRNQARLAAAGGAKKDPVNLFPTPGPATPNSMYASSRGRKVREWTGGDKYNKVSTIGKGAFAVVYKVLEKFNGVPYAAKELEKRRFMKNGIVDAKVDNEMNIMRKIQHPNVVQFIEHIDWHDYLYIIMEYVPGGDLGSLINERGHLSEFDVKIMGEQIISALGYLHEQGITHRDVKPDNILIQNRDPFQVKLTDFGLSKMITSEETFLRTFCGTLLYCAPEVYSEYREYDDTGRRHLRGADRRALPPQRYGHAVDIWSLAGVLFYALCGSPPYPVKNGTSYQELLNQIMTMPLDIRPLQRAGVSDDGIRFVRRMLHIRPEHRATIPELQRTAWLRGYASFELSLGGDDEVDMIGAAYDDSQLDDSQFDNSQLEQEASQLSINDDRQVNDSQDDVSEATDIQQPENPSSFNTSEDMGNGESYGFMQDYSNPSNGRLFGEVDVSALGSSGAIPTNLIPQPTRDRVAFSQESSDYSQSDVENQFNFNNADSRQLHPNHPASAMPTDMPPPPPPRVATTQHSTAVSQLPTQRNGEIEAQDPIQHGAEGSVIRSTDDRAVRSSSLLGAESMVGHLNMHSPASAGSPGAQSPMQTTEPHDINPAVSLRRPRDEEADDYDDDTDWRPSGMPSKRQRKSSREIEMPIPPSTFWDPKDKSTHHNDYPRMSSTDFFAYQSLATSKGEKFMPGHKTFEQTMDSFRSSRSPSMEPDANMRAFSEPTKEEGRRMLMKRDERQLADALTNISTTQGGPVQDPLIANTIVSMGAPEPRLNEHISPRSESLPRVGNDFQQPKRIIAKLSSTGDSVLSTINLNITDSVTSWGRGALATVRYPHAGEDRIPKYAFKLLIFKPDFYTKLGGEEPQEWKDADQDLKLYISTKASQGIWVNGISIPSFDPKDPENLSKYWAPLHHGDEITLWHRKDRNGTRYLRLKFECFWGSSKEPRNGKAVEVVKEGAFLAELEHVCLVNERRILKEQIKRAEAEKAVEQTQKDAARQPATATI